MDRSQLCPLQLLESSLRWMPEAPSTPGLESDQLSVSESRYSRHHLRLWSGSSSRRSCPSSMILWLKVKEGSSDQGASGDLEPAKQTPAL